MITNAVASWPDSARQVEHEEVLAAQKRERVAVLHVVDSLDCGGAERAAVDIANHLPREQFRVFLCSTRAEGPLAKVLAPDVGRLSLQRTFRFDVAAFWRLLAFIRRHDIRILHAHGTSLFLAVAAGQFPPYPAVVWHDQYGRYAVAPRSGLLYSQFLKRTRAVIAVNEPLADWARAMLPGYTNRVRYLPNFVDPCRSNDNHISLPGTPGARIACVANLRKQKDHPTLLRAMTVVRQHHPAAHLLLVGSGHDGNYIKYLKDLTRQLGLDHHVTFLGERMDVPAILKACDVGVLSSVSEGLPLSLVEYGMAGLPSVATNIGQCAEVLGYGSKGVLVRPSDPDELGRAIHSLLVSPKRRAALGRRLLDHVLKHYTPAAVIPKICDVYSQVLVRDEAGG